MRFWEKEFPQLAPSKKKGQRLYSPKDIELIFKIKHLVQDKGFTLEGAKKELSKSHSEKMNLLELLQGLEEIKQELKKIKEIISQ